MNNEASLRISILALICSITIAYYSRRQYKLSKMINILRPHSDRLSDMFGEWLRSGQALPHVFSIRNIPDQKLESLEHTLSSLKEERGHPLTLNPLALEHLKTGYPQIYERLTNIWEEARTHNKNILEYLLSLSYKAKNILGLPEPYGHPAEKYAYYSRIIIYTLKSIVTGYPEAEPSIEASSSKPRSYELQWEGGTLICGSEEDCKKGLEVVRNVKISEADKIKEFEKSVNDLSSKISKLSEEMNLRLIDSIKIGGLLEGKCDICSKYQ